MFTPKPRLEIASRMFLIAVILFNALIPTAASAKSSVTASDFAGAFENKKLGKSSDIDLLPRTENQYRQRFARPISNVSEQAKPLLQSSEGWLVCDYIGYQTNNGNAGYCDPAYNQGTYIRGVITNHSNAGRYMTFHNVGSIPSNKISFRFLVSGVVNASCPWNSPSGRYLFVSSHSVGNMDDRGDTFGNGLTVAYDVNRTYLDRTILGQFEQGFKTEFQIEVGCVATNTVYGYFEAWVGDYPVTEIDPNSVLFFGGCGVSCINVHNPEHAAH
jgi:hypothetical protein